MMDENTGVDIIELIHSRGYNLKLGYFLGYFAGLEASENRYQKPASHWKDPAKTDLKKMLRQLQSHMCNEEKITLKKEPRASQDPGQDKPEFFILGYNQGYFFGSEARETLKERVPSAQLEDHAKAFIFCLRTFNLKIHRVSALQKVLEMDPEKEHSYLMKFIDEFTLNKKTQPVDGEVMREALQLLDDGKVQQSVKAALDHFRSRTDLLHYSEALDLHMRLLELRQDLKWKDVSKEQYREGMKELTSDLSDKLNAWANG